MENTLGKKRMDFKPHDFIVPSVIFLSLILGLSAGYFLHSLLRSPSFSVAGGEEAYKSLMAEVVLDKETKSKIISKYKPGQADYTATFKPYEAVTVAYDIWASHQYSCSRGIGEYEAMGLAKQMVYSTGYQEGVNAFEESVSTGTVYLAHRMYESNGKTVMYVKDGNSPYKFHFEKTNEDYAYLYGRKVSESLVYIVTPKTESKTDYSGRGLSSFVKNPDGTYQVEFEGDPTTCCLNYIFQMKNISDLKDYPTFDYVHLSWKLDENLNLLYFNTYEKYNAFANVLGGVKSDVEGGFTTVFMPSTKEDHHVIGSAPNTEVEGYPSSRKALLKQYGY